MDKTGLAAVLHMLDWKQTVLAQRLGVHVNTVSGWATGSMPVPDYVAEYLRVMELARLMLK